MPFDLNSGRLDAKRIERGVWWQIHLNADRTFGGAPLPGEPGDLPALLIRPADTEWLRAREAAEKPYRGRKLTPDEERKVLGEAIAASLWRGCANIAVDGVPLEWGEHRAATMLASKEWWNLADFILWAAQSRAALAAEEEATASGN